MKLPNWLSAPDDGDLRLIERLNVLIETQRQTNVLLERLIHQKSSGPTKQGTRSRADATPSARNPSSVGARRPKATGRRSKGAQRSPALHDEIEAVLREAGHPLPAKLIADRICERGMYTPPRSSKPLSGSNVNSRIANPTYRSRFVRRDDGIWLTSPDAGSPGG